MTAGRRAPNPPWKHIYGVDRKYTARVDRLRTRQQEDAEDTASLLAAAKRYEGRDLSTFPELT